MQRPSLVTDETPGVQGKVEEVQQRANRVLLFVRGKLEVWAATVERWQRSRWRRAVLPASTVDIGEIIGPADVAKTLQATIEWNVGLVKDVSEQVRQRIGNAVFSGLHNRSAARDVAREIMLATQMARARRIAADQLVKISSALADERRRQAGLMLWEWKHSGKLHPRPEHVARDGNIYSDAPVPDDYTVDGKSVMRSPEDRPGQWPNCGCVARAVIDWNTLGD